MTKNRVDYHYLADWYIREAIQLGLSGAQMIREMREAGLGIRVQKVYELIRNIKGEEPGPVNYNSVGLNKRFTESSATLSDSDMQHKFLIFTKVTSRNNANGDIVEFPVSISYSELPTRGEHLDAVRGTLINPDSGTDYTIVNMDTLAVYKRNDFEE